jgi:mRNA-degrading endonuclease RelE of RelBE toxin-antitoxin system
MWEIRGTRRVDKKLSRLDQAIRVRYNRAFAHLAQDPGAGKSLPGYENLFSFRLITLVGEHRILYRLHREAQIVYVVLVGTPEELYDLLN